MEGLAFNPFERKDRQIDHSDNDDAENTRPDDFSTGRGHETEAFIAIEQPPETFLLFAKSSQAVFDDDHGAIDDQSKIERAQAHQIGRSPGGQHA